MMIIKVTAGVLMTLMFPGWAYVMMTGAVASVSPSDPGSTLGGGC